MKTLPEHGWIGCTQCYQGTERIRAIGRTTPPAFQIEQPNGSWGAREPLVMILGFSRGQGQDPTQPFDKVAFAGMRDQLTKIVRALGLLQGDDHVDRRINARERDFHFASLFRCSISMWSEKEQRYGKSGNAILEKFLGSPDTRSVAETCTQRFLGSLPARTKLVVLLGNSSAYVQGCMELMRRLHPSIRPINEVAYGDGRVTWVHTIHAKAQGSYLPQWLNGADTAVGRKLAPARAAVEGSGVLDLLAKPVRIGY